MKRKVSLQVSTVLALVIALAPSLLEGARFELLSRSLLQKSPRAAVFSGDLTVMASGGALAILGAGAPKGSWRLVPLDGEPFDLVAGGSFVYAATRRCGLVTVDLSEPEAPDVSISHGCGDAFLVALFDGGLLVADMRLGVVAFDLADPSRPAPADTLDGSGRPAGLAGCGASAAVAWPGRISVTGPGPDDDLVELSSIDTGKGVSALRGSRGRLAAVFQDGSLGLWDLSDPAAPAGQQPPPFSGRALDAALTEDGLMVLLDSGRIIFTGGAGPSPPTRELKAGYSAGAEAPGVNFSIAERISGGFSKERTSGRFPGTRLSAGHGSLVTFDPRTGFWIYGGGQGGEGSGATGPRGPDGVLEFISYVEATGFAIDLFALDGYLYLANGADGLRTGRLGEGGSVEWTGRHECEVARDVAASGSLLVLAGGGGGIETLDAGNGAPFRLASLGSPFYQSAVVIDGDHAFVAGGLGGAEVVDISDPSSPRLVWRERLSEVRGVFADAERFYIPDGFEGVRIYSRDDPPGLLSVTDTPGWSCDVHAEGGYLYVADGGNGILIMDISDPTAPATRGSVDIGSIAREIHLTGRTLFVASHVGGITAVDVSDPDRPFVAARYPTVDDARGVYADEDLVYLASGAGGVYIFRYIDQATSKGGHTDEQDR